MTMPAPAVATRATADSLNHYYCCNDARSLCGVDLTGHDDVDTVDCVVCVDLDASNAPCGRPDCPWAVTA